MQVAEYVTHDATSLADLIARREISAAEALAAALAVIDAGEPRYNAIAVDARDRARMQKARPGHFAGVPFLLKDINQDYAGLPMTMGAKPLRHNIAKRNATLTERYLAAGLVIIGSTTTPELGLKATTETALHGATRNPWDTGRTPGGSSGGSAAAVAGGYVPMAGASDGGGSIRIPAAYCGLFGLKPSRGRVPEGPMRGEAWEGAVASHALTRSVRDSAALLDAIAGPEPGGPFIIAPPARPYIEELKADPGRLRIGFSVASPVGGKVDADIVAATRKAASKLETLGHHVEEAAPAIDGRLLARCYMTLYFGHVAAATAQIRQETGAKANQFEADTNALAMLGRALPAGGFVAMREHWNDFARALAAYHARFNLYMTPVTAMMPARIGELDTPKPQQTLVSLMMSLRAGSLMLKSGIIDQLAARSLERTPFTQLANLTFVPAMSVPMGQNMSGLPIGMQFMAPFGREDRLIRLAAQIEAAFPWAVLPPS
jgi:amidase